LENCEAAAMDNALNRGPLWDGFIRRLTEYAIILLDADGNIAAWNVGAELIKGYAEEEIVGQHFSVFYPAEAREAGHPQELLEAAITTGYCTEEGWRIRQDGSRFWALVVIAAIRDDNGAVIGFGEVTRDLTRRKETESQLRQHVSELEEARNHLEARTVALQQAEEAARAADRAKSEFLANMSHELRTPLNAILGFSEIIDGALFGPINARYRGYAHDIHDAGSHLLTILNEILDLSKIEAGRLELSLESLALQGLFDECRHLLQEQEGVRVVFHQTSLFVTADIFRLKQILLNLLSNAIKFTPAGGSVTVTAAAKPETDVAISVRDTGIGMTPEEIPLALEPFGQIASARKSPQQGTGLGLSITRRLIELHGGKMEIASAPGQGTTVTFTLSQYTVQRAQYA
jgi:PAS domain S-box-containing protein